MHSYEQVISWVVTGIETVGVAIMTIGGAVVLFRYAFPRGANPVGRDYQQLRKDLGRVILVGLEILIVADIVRTVIVVNSLESVVVLGIIVLIRTILSFSLEVEIDGRWPWQHAPKPQ